MTPSRGSARKIALIAVAITFLFGGVLTVHASSGDAIWTDQTSYAPQSLVTIYGSGFLQNAPVTMSVVQPNGTLNTWGITSDVYGNFSTTYQLDDLNGTYYVTATDGVNTATTSFTDPPVATTTTLSIPATGSVLTSGLSYPWSGTVTPASSTIPAGDTVNLYYTTDGSCPTSGVGTGVLLASTTTSSGGGFSSSFTAPAAGSYKFFARYPPQTHPPSGTSFAGSNSACASITVNPATASVTVTTSPSALTNSIVVDGITYTSPQTFTWVIGSSHSISANSPISGGIGVQYVWISWSDGGAQSHQVTAPSSPTTYTAAYQKQYLLTLVSSQDTPTGAGWYNSGLTAGFSMTSTVVSGATGTQYVFAGWSSGDSGGYTGASTSASVVVNNPITETASWTTQYWVQYTSTGCVLPVSLPVSEWVNSGGSATGSFPSTVSGSGTQCLFVGDNRPSTISGPTTIKATYQTQYYVTVTSPHDTPTASAWVNAGGSFTASVTSPADIVVGDHQWVSTGFSIDGGASQAGTTYTFANVQSPHSITFAWVEQFWIQVNSAHDSPTSSQWVNQGGSLTVSATSPADDNGLGTRYRTTGYTLDGNPAVTDGSSSYAVTNVQSAHTITFNWLAQYYVQYAQNGCILTMALPSAEWVDSGAPATGVFPASVTDGAGTRCNFLGDNRPSVITFPTTITGSYQTQYQVTYADSGCVLPVSDPSSEWVNSGGSATGVFPSLVSGSGTRCVFLGDDRPSTITAPTTITGTYRTQYQFTFIQSGSGAPATVNWSFSNGTSGSATAPFSIWADSSATNTLSYTYENPVPGTTGVRYVLSNSISPNPAPAAPLSPTGGRTILGTYTIQYLLTVSVSPNTVGVGNIGFSVAGQDCSPVSPTYTVSCWYDSGIGLTLTANPVLGYTFGFWSLDSIAKPIGVDKLTVTMAAPHSALAAYGQFTMNAYTTDSNFNPINGLTSVFTQCSSSSCQLTATNPGTEYYILEFANTGPTTLNNLVVYLTIPYDSAFGGCAFILKPSSMGQPVQVNNAPVSYSLAGCNLSITAGSVGAGQTITITVHLDYAFKYMNYGKSCPTGSPTYCTATRFARSYSFLTQVGFGSPMAAANPAALTVVGQKVTAIGGYLLDTNGNPKSGLTVVLCSSSSGCSPATYLSVCIDPTTGATGQLCTENSGNDGWYFFEVPAGTYTVEVFNSVPTNVGTTNNVKVSSNQFVEVDFKTLSPADPAVQGFVKDSNGNPISGTVVQLFASNGKLVATTTTDAGGYYVFRFYQPGTYTVKVVLPTGYTCSTGSVSVSLSQFQTATVDFILTNS